MMPSLRHQKSEAPSCMLMFIQRISAKFRTKSMHTAVALSGWAGGKAERHIKGAIQANTPSFLAASIASPIFEFAKTRSFSPLTKSFKCITVMVRWV